MRWLVVAIFLFGLLASLAWYDADEVYSAGHRTMFAIIAITAFAAVIVMGATLM